MAFMRSRILIVDDEPYNVDYLEQELADLEYDTLSAFSGQEALEQIEAGDPDMILLDIMMPEMDGFEVLGLIKQNEDWRHIPVVIISAVSDMQSVIRGIELGAEDYLPKPFDPILLQARLTSGLERKRLRDQEQLYLQSLERELDIAREIQAGFLPQSMPDVEGWELAAHFQAARKVAGDFYDAFPIADTGRLGIVLGDVCDKGVGAALFMTQFRSLLRAVSNLDHYAGHSGERNVPEADPAAVLQQTISLVNNYIAITHEDSGMFATIFFGALDPQTGSLLYINAGHEPPVVMNASGVREHLRPTGPLVGLLPDMAYQVGETTLEPGDALLVFSDGVPDAQNAAEEFFGEGPLPILLPELGAMEAASLLATINEEVYRFVEGMPQPDDITMLAVRHRKA